MWLLVHPLAPLVTFAIANTLALCGLMWLGVQPSSATESVVALGWYMMVLFWLESDAYHRRRRPCFDFGLIALFFFPMSVVWYCFWSRGWRGAATLGLLLALWLGPYFAAIFVAILRAVVG